MPLQFGCVIVKLEQGRNALQNVTNIIFSEPTKKINTSEIEIVFANVRSEKIYPQDI